MAGHSKFKNIMHRKGAQDKRRAVLFARIGREIQVAAREGGGSPDENPRLRTAISAARAQNMSKDNINRAIERAKGVGIEDLIAISYEGYGPGKIAIIVDCITDNKNRSVSNVRSCFSKNGGNMTEPNSVKYFFSRVGEIILENESDLENEKNIDDDKALEVALEAGATDFESRDSDLVFYTEESELHKVADNLSKALNLPTKEAQLIWQASNETKLSGEEFQKAIKLLEALEDLDDVQAVSSNLALEE